MNFNYKLFFKYILFYTNQTFFKNLFKNDKNLNIFVSEQLIYYLSLHIKLSTLFYSTQLIDIFVYELPNKIINNKNINNSILVYNFHSIQTHQRFFIFVSSNLKKNFNKRFINWTSLNSITELFLNANWLEREVIELHGIFLNGKKDLRNLMLPYGDTSTPMKKSLPSIGFREIFYDSVSDLLIQSPVTIQF